MVARRCDPGTEGSGLSLPKSPVPPTETFRAISGPTAPEPTPGLRLETVMLMSPEQVGTFSPTIAADQQSTTVRMLESTPGWMWPASDGSFNKSYSIGLYAIVPADKQAAWQAISVRGQAVLEAGARAEIQLIPGDAWEPDLTHAKVISLEGPLNGPFEVAHEFPVDALAFYEQCGISYSSINVKVKVDGGSPFRAAQIDLHEISALKFAMRDCAR